MSFRVGEMVVALHPDPKQKPPLDGSVNVVTQVTASGFYVLGSLTCWDEAAFVSADEEAAARASAPSPELLSSIEGDVAGMLRAAREEIARLKVLLEAEQGENLKLRQRLLTVSGAVATFAEDLDAARTKLSEAFPGS